MEVGWGRHPQGGAGGGGKQTRTRSVFFSGGGLWSGCHLSFSLWFFLFSPIGIARISHLASRGKRRFEILLVVGRVIFHFKITGFSI